MLITSIVAQYRGAGAAVTLQCRDPPSCKTPVQLLDILQSTAMAKMTVVTATSAMMLLAMVGGVTGSSADAPFLGAHRQQHNNVATATDQGSPPCSIWWLTEQNTYSSFNLRPLGIGVGAVSINDDYFAAGGGTRFMPCTHAMQLSLLLVSVNVTTSVETPYRCSRICTTHPSCAAITVLT